MRVVLSFRAGSKIVSIPSTMVEEVRLLRPGEIVVGRERELAALAGGHVPLIRIAELFSPARPSSRCVLVAVCVIEGVRLALEVDELKGVGRLAHETTHVPGGVDRLLELAPEIHRRAPFATVTAHPARGSDHGRPARISRIS